jgi:protein ATS1
MLFALGSNSSGQLGIGHNEDVAVPTEAALPVSSSAKVISNRIVTIAAGGNHTLILYDDGNILASGDNSDGRCSLKIAATELNKSTQLTTFVGGDELPSDIPANVYKCCVTTWQASICINNDGRIICCGTGTKGELGLGKGVTHTPVPQTIPSFPPEGTKVVNLAASMGHVVTVLSNGDVYGWGAGRKGQIGSPPSDQWSPKKIEGIPFSAHLAVCGREFTYIVGEPSDGKHIVIGSDKWSVISDAPKDLPPWKSIGASWGSIFVLLQTGTILSWGRNDHGQLCPPNLPLVEQIAIGSEHALALTSNGQVIAWGWGEHGNCGQPTSDGDVKGTWNVLPGIGKVYNIGAGCATSFIAYEDN